ncbi:hypothetical protein FQR65_LT07503 [Abscondita terminalis]|nr:hypothetical protein FQR65_LT07503 [Abscondita terminalis]
MKETRRNLGELIGETEMGGVITVGDFNARGRGGNRKGMRDGKRKSKDNTEEEDGIGRSADVDRDRRHEKNTGRGNKGAGNKTIDNGNHRAIQRETGQKGTNKTRNGSRGARGSEMDEGGTRKEDVQT